ncbi:hypothetical protein DS745_22655 [Anaerobacillus alkaliphilus]|uniref:Uncharacterized protein n=1 Tax=Anaerobacillus alkaliphilus TaxID=1548597 RepID=A0A4Q0VNT9_9BACI|nr:endospore germination permease [Anaerobacillus alkaliphilus]RXI96512.1 hypothetical protein DS745_22655 [Anaerobacillus alkaliphilus]
MNEQTGFREFLAIVLFTITLRATDMTPAILLPNSNTALWLLPIIWALVITLPLSLLFSLFKQYPQTNLMDLCYQLLGRYGGALAGCLLLSFVLFITVLHSRSYVDILSTLYFEKTPIIAIYVVLLGSSYFIASKGLEIIGRTAWIFLPYVKVMLFLVVVLVWKDLNVDRIFPLSGPGIQPLVMSGASYTFVFGELVLFTLLLPCVKGFQNFKNASWLGLGIVMVELSIFFAAFIMLFDYASAGHLIYPYHQLARVIHIGRFITNMEAFFLLFWTIGSLLRFSIYLYLVTVLLAQTLRLKEYKPLLLPVSTFVILVGIIPENAASIIAVARDDLMLPFVFTTIIVGIPVLLWVVSKGKGKGEAKSCDM